MLAEREADIPAVDVVDREIGRARPRRLDAADVNERIPRAQAFACGLARGGLELLEVAHVLLADPARLRGSQNRPVSGNHVTQGIAVKRLEELRSGYQRARKGASEQGDRDCREVVTWEQDALLEQHVAEPFPAVARRVDRDDSKRAQADLPGGDLAVDAEVHGPLHSPFRAAARQSRERTAVAELRDGVRARHHLGGREVRDAADVVVVGMRHEQEGAPVRSTLRLACDRRDLFGRDRRVAQQHFARRDRQEGVRLPQRGLETPDVATEIVCRAHAPIKPDSAGGHDRHRTANG